MWQHLLERFVPLMDDDVSSLDQRDGVGRSTGLVMTTPARVVETTAHQSRIHAAYEGSISPLAS